MNRFLNIKESLEKFDQSHLLTYWDSLSESQHNQLLDDIERVNLVEVSLAAEKLTSYDYADKKNMQPVPYEVLENIPESKRKEYTQKGIGIIGEGKVAAVLLAGGQGTRLGHDGPKGTYDIGLPGHESLFELQAKRLLELYKQTGNMIPWYIMTSPINDGETKLFFHKHNYFGYNPELITFFVQPTAPALTPDGKLMLKTKSSLSVSPNGNGGVFSALSSSGALADMEKGGVKWIFLYNVDNAMIQIADPIFVGFADEKDSPIASKSVVKRNAQEKVGVFCLKDGKPSVIEYSEITNEEHSDMTNAHISIHLFKLDFVKGIADKPLPYHFAHKPISTVDDRGEEIKPIEPNGYKLEQFYFDVFPAAESIAVLQVPREKEFAPVKNKSGEDSPETARDMILSISIIQLLEKAGLESYKQAIASWIYPSAKLVLKPVPDDSLPAQSSKVGGNPDLPEEMIWPKWKDYEMTFIAQINLEECPSELSLPGSGLLSFFYAVEPMFEDKDFFGDPHTCRVIYTGADQLDRISRRETPSGLHAAARMRPNRISFIPQLSVPASESAFLESLGLGWSGNREDFEKYWSVFLPELREQWGEEIYINRLLGHPDQIQGDMQVSCERAYGQYPRDDRYNSKLREQMVNSALKWRLLLQIDSEEKKTGIMWGDVGRIYFWIHEDDLQALRFDRVICEMQCS